MMKESVDRTTLDHYQIEEILRRGPLRSTKFRDKPCCIAFMIYWAILVGFALWAFLAGDLALYMAPYDSSGRMCGVSAGYSQTGYAYYNISNKDFYVCIS